MIQLNSKNLKSASLAHLATAQTEIDSELTYEAKTKKAKTKWAGKTGSVAAKLAFADVKSVLTDMCSGVQICVYCEHNEATDIEHIYPKRLYPEKAFVWTNYVFACGRCNTHYKGENFMIFNPSGSATVQDITPQANVYIIPSNDDAVFINQRLEDPMSFLELDILNQQYIFIERNTSGRDYEKAKYTKELLGLNERADLVRQRKAAHRWYFSELTKYVALKNAPDFNTLIFNARGEININLTSSFEIEKQKALDTLKLEILSHSHPTVWKELIRQRAFLPQTNILINQATEILTW